jgi:cell wall-associated NlpC family hydrolase
LRRVSRAQINAAADEYGIPRGIFYGLVSAESGGRVDARSPVGAYGPTQLMPDTAKGLGVNPRDPFQNLRGGAKYLKQQYDKFGNWRLALAAYNAGPGNVQKYGGIPPFAETRAYVKRILSHAAGTRTPVRPETTPEPQTGGEPLTAGPDLSSFAFGNLSHISGGGRADPVFQLGMLTQSIASQPAHQQIIHAASQPAPAARTAGAAGGVLAFAKTQLGQPYVWGGESRKEGGFDCSGLIQAAYASIGINIPRVTFDQMKGGKKVAWANLRPGDLVFANGGNHVVLYVGNGQVIAAPHTGAKVRYQPLNDFKSSFTTARRYL